MQTRTSIELCIMRRTVLVYLYKHFLMTRYAIKLTKAEVEELMAIMDKAHILPRPSGRVHTFEL
jgi:hypothetical protein